VNARAVLIPTTIIMLFTTFKMKQGILLWILFGAVVIAVMIALNYLSKNACDEGYLHMRELYGTWKCVPINAVKESPKQPPHPQKSPP
jgi:hypothetical protein